MVEVRHGENNGLCDVIWWSGIAATAEISNWLGVGKNAKPLAL
jgi:hypothetical protein